MKIFKVKISMPMHWNAENGAELKAADQASVDAFLSTLGNVHKDSEHGNSYVMGADDFATTMVHFSGAGYDAIKVECCELIMDTLDPMEALRPMLERMELAAARLSGGGYYETAPGFSDHANAPIPGPNLLGISRLMLLEDCCTDELQTKLDEGWRLIAVCPQEARRPDYILGRAGEPGKAYNRAER